MDSILEYLESSAVKYPTKIAVSYRDEHISFSNLEKQARRLGGVLKTQYRNQPIGVFANRSIQPAVWYLAVLYSGNFYVPLDPEMPTEKLQAIIDETQFPYIIGDKSNQTRLGELNFCGRFVMPADIAGQECDIPEIEENTPAYMIYTSGSTGKPKGVLKSHAAVRGYIEAFCNAFSFDANEVIGNQTPFFFDASAKDFYLMLKTGATLEILPTELFSMPTQLIEYMNEKKISFASWVPTAISIVAQLNPFSLVKPVYLRRLFFVGEVMPMKHLNKWREALPEIQYVNLYGQSELAGICCYYEVRGEFDNSAVLPMGKPLENCHIYLLEQGRVINEPGKIGEMYIASPSLASEYYHDAEKTANSFLTVDFGNGPERCFKTGDLAQYDADSNLVFASRSDFQIKHMGHRIELGEIEAVAGALPEIDRCCCLYHAEKRKIYLFCQLNTETPDINGREIQSILRKKLSSYMLPGKVVIMEALPLSANGKIDRQKLKTALVRG